eukprot:m.127390 g.127390  ORF g.127390 m.127390 type:complete len:248 (-) comp13008_c0_seq1:3014-3757(-)
MNFEDWARSVPPVTRVLFFGSAAVTLLANFGVIPPSQLILNFPLVFNEFEIWRLFGSVFFFGKLGFPFLINLYFLYSYSKQLETGIFAQKTADYVYMILVIWLVLLLVGFLVPLMLIGLPLVFAIVHVWCHTNPNQILSFWFGTKFKAIYFPWVLFGFSILTGKGGIAELIGIICGHIYFFLKFKYPELGGQSFLETPLFIKRFFPDDTGGVRAGVHGDAPAARRPNQPPPPRNMFGGRGHVLGGNN